MSRKKTTLPQLHDLYPAPHSLTSSKPSTFKVPPITEGKILPIPITLIDNKLRIFNENAFQDFLKTMFNSDEELAVKHDVANSTEKRKKPETTNNYDEITEKYEPVTEFEDVSFDEREERDKHASVTVMNEENKSITNYIDDEKIEKLIENVDLEEIDKDEVKITPVVVKEYMNNVDGIKTNSSHKPKKTLLTSLYLSDVEKKRNVNPDDSPDLNDEGNHVYKGMSIPVNNFKDLTRTKETSRVLPEIYLYGLLSKVFRQEIPLVVNT